MSLKIKTDKPTNGKGLTITQLNNLIFLMYRSNYTSFFPFSYNDKTGEGRFVGYAGSLCSTNETDESFDIDFPEGVDVYICPNGMKNHWSRKADNLINIQNLVIDIDSHNSLLSSHDLQKHIREFRKKLIKKLKVKPNFVHYTGRGIHLWYCIEPCHVSLNKICLSVIDMLCKDIENKMNELDEVELSIDRASSLKLNGLFRLPYTYNTKSKTWSDGELIHEETPNINELKSKLHNLGYESAYFGEKKKKHKRKEYVYQKDLKLKDYTPCLIHRKRFLEYIIENRDIQVGSRDIIIFAMYSTVSMLYESVDAQQYCLDINDGFNQPLKFSEMVSIFNEIDKKHHRFTVEKFFTFINANEEEIKWFNKSTKKELDKQDKKNKKADKYNQVKEMYSQGKKVATIARDLNMSRTTVYKILNG